MLLRLFEARGCHVRSFVSSRDTSRVEDFGINGGFETAATARWPESLHHTYQRVFDTPRFWPYCSSIDQEAA